MTSEQEILDAIEDAEASIKRHVALRNAALNDADQHQTVINNNRFMHQELKKQLKAEHGKQTVTGVIRIALRKAAQP